MEIPVLVESVAGNGYRAELFALVGEGATPEDALKRLQESVSAKLRSGAVVKSIEIPPKENPWLRGAGMYDPNDPLVQEWLQIIQEQRDSEIV